jgi:hypothetical protein
MREIPSEIPLPLDPLMTIASSFRSLVTPLFTMRATLTKMNMYFTYFWIMVLILSSPIR